MGTRGSVTGLGSWDRGGRGALSVDAIDILQLGEWLSGSFGVGTPVLTGPPSETDGLHEAVKGQVWPSARGSSPWARFGGESLLKLRGGLSLRGRELFGDLYGLVPVNDSGIVRVSIANIVRDFSTGEVGTEWNSEVVPENVWVKSGAG